jgi:hypothetical protein
VERKTTALVEEAEVLVRRGPRLLSVLESHGRPPGLHSGADVLVVGLRASLPPSSPPASGLRGQGRIPPRWLGLGAPGGCGGGYFIAGIGARHVDAKDAREGVWPHRDGAPCLVRRLSAHRRH